MCRGVRLDGDNSAKGMISSEQDCRVQFRGVNEQYPG